MATLASNAQWYSSPKIYFDVSYEKKREGATQYYQITVTCDPLTGSSYFGFPIYLEIKLDGTTADTKRLKKASPSQWSSSITYTTGWLAVPNKTDGTTALAVRIYSGMGSDRNKTFSYTLSVDPAASKIGATDANIESASTITITKYDANFTTTVSYKAAGQSSFTAIWTNQKHTAYGWTVPSSLYSLIPNAKEIEITLQCQTYSGSTLIGTETCTMTATASESKCKPKVSVSSEDVNAESLALTGNKKYIVNGISNLKVVTTATAQNGATISSIKAYCGGKDFSGSTVIFPNVLFGATYVIVTDSRGFSTRVDDESITMIRYIEPTIVPTITRDTPTGDTVTVSVKGKWYNGSFGAAANTLRITVRRKTSSDANHHTMVDVPVTVSGNEYTATVQLSGIDYTKAYNFLLRLDDAIYTDAKGYRDAKYAFVDLAKGIPVFDWGEDDFRFNVPVTLPGGMLADYVVEEAYSGDWYYRKWAQGLSEAWYHKNLTPQPFTNKLADGLYSNDTYAGVVVDIPEGIFNYAPIFTSVNAFSNVAIQSRVSSASLTWVAYGLWTSYSTTPSNLTVQIHVVGRWKQR